MTYTVRGTDGTLFNVRMNGVDVALGISRESAEDYMQQRRITGGFCQIYRTDSPISERKPAWRKASLPRPMSLHVSDAEREKAWKRILSDSDVTYAEDTEEPTTLLAALVAASRNDADLEAIAA